MRSFPPSVDSGRRVLAIEDNADTAQMIATVLRGRGYVVVTAPDGVTGLAILARNDVDIVLLDLTLPGMDGIEVCRNIRAASDVPVIIVSGRRDVADVVEGLDAGADDYIRKPFDPDELLARIRARLRPAVTAGGSGLHIADLTIDTARRTVTRGTEELRLTPMEYTLLVTLAGTPWKAFTRDELLREVWGYQAGGTRVVDVHIQRLRAKIEPDPTHPRYVLTVRSVGYRAGD